jgi:hypothetical protein
VFPRCRWIVWCISARGVSWGIEGKLDDIEIGCRGGSSKAVMSVPSLLRSAGSPCWRINVFGADNGRTTFAVGYLSIL